VKEVKYPLTACQKMAMMRNIEKMIVDALNDHREVIVYYIFMRLHRPLFFNYYYRVSLFYIQRIIERIINHIVDNWIHIICR